MGSFVFSLNYYLVDIVSRFVNNGSELTGITNLAWEYHKFIFIKKGFCTEFDMDVGKVNKKLKSLITFT